MMPSVDSVVDIPETLCVTKVGEDGLTPNPHGSQCGTKTNQALLLANMPGMGKRKVQMPACENHIKIYLGEIQTAQVGVQPEGNSRPTMVCPDCGRHPISQPCRLGPRRLP